MMDGLACIVNYAYRFDVSQAECLLVKPGNVWESDIVT